jgi:glycopeptide antibiotics resistance protein
VLGAIVLAQIPGAAIGWWWAPIGDTFFDLWYGAAVTVPFGFILGLLWQEQTAPDSLARHRWVIVAYGVFSTALPLFGWLTYDIWRAAL